MSNKRNVINPKTYPIDLDGESLAPGFSGDVTDSPEVQRLIDAGVIVDNVAEAVKTSKTKDSK